MASTFSPSLRIELIGNGDQSGTWGTTTNNNLGTLIEQAIAGVVTITMANANYTLTNFNGIEDEARNQVIVAEGANSAVRDIIIPLVEKTYTIKNSTTGGFGVRVIGSSGTGVTIPNGVTTTVYCDGINVYTANTGTAGNFSVNGNLSASGTTTLAGALAGTTASFSGAISSVSPTFTGIPTAPTAAPGTNTTQIASTAFVLANGVPSGAIIMWSGSIASIPSGWLLCNGTSGTPDLRDRFIVGASQDSGGVARTNITGSLTQTGGSKDAIVVSHNHTATSSVSDPGHVHPPLAPAQNYFGGPNNGQSPRGDVSQGTTVSTTGTAFTGISVSTTVASSGSSGTNANLPPYYALAYIMKA